MRVRGFWGIRRERDEAAVRRYGVRAAGGAFLGARELVGEVCIRGIECGGLTKLVARRDTIAEDGRLLAALGEIARLPLLVSAGRARCSERCAGGTPPDRRRTSLQWFARRETLRTDDRWREDENARCATKRRPHLT